MQRTARASFVAGFLGWSPSRNIFQCSRWVCRAGGFSTASQLDEVPSRHCAVFKAAPTLVGMFFAGRIELPSPTRMDIQGNSTLAISLYT